MNLSNCCGSNGSFGGAETLDRKQYFDEDDSLLKWNVPKMIRSTETGDKRKSEEESAIQTKLDMFFPPRKWESKNRRQDAWLQKVSTEPASRADVIKVAQKLNIKMVELNARNNGVCDIRRRLYTQLMDEIIRQIIIQNYPLGMLLLRVRDELNMNILTRRDLVQSGVEYGIRKAIEAERGRQELEDLIEILKTDKEQLEEEKKIALKSVVEKERKSIAERDLLEALHREKMEQYEKTNKALQDLLDSIMISKK